MTSNREEVLRHITQLLSDVARDWDYSRAIGPETQLFSELGFESLDIVVLGTAIQEHYRKPMPFSDLFAEIGQRDKRDYRWPSSWSSSPPIWHRR